MEKEDSEQDPDTLRERIERQKRNKLKYKKISKQLDQTGEVQFSSSDPDSRQMITRNHITEVAYNVQATVDSDHNIPVDYLVTNENDSKAMGTMLERTVEILETKEFVTLYDKGYHTGSEFQIAEKLEVQVIVAAPEVASHAPDIRYDVERFEYNQKGDLYICPQGFELHTNSRYYNKDRGRSQTLVKHYKTPACKTCPVMELCTRNKAGRLIERSEYAELIEENKQRVKEFQDLYRKRQEIIEHVFGTMKRQWDFSYIMTKRFMHRASADVGLIFTAYNLKRLFSILGQTILKDYFIKMTPTFSNRNELTTSFRSVKMLLDFRTGFQNQILRVA